jgi:hypothetical protein
MFIHDLRLLHGEPYLMKNTPTFNEEHYYLIAAEERRTQVG